MYAPVHSPPKGLDYGNASPAIEALCNGGDLPTTAKPNSGFVAAAGTRAAVPPRCAIGITRWTSNCAAGCWLSLDRPSSVKLTMTQELIANTLGVRREGVTEAAGKLQKLGVITYRRGQIAVLDRPRLEQLCCQCYGVVKKETDRLLPLHPLHLRGEQPLTPAKTLALTMERETS